MEREAKMLNLAEPWAPQDSSREWEVKPSGAKVTKTFDIPFRWICRLHIETRSGTPLTQATSRILVG